MMTMNAIDESLATSALRTNGRDNIVLPNDESYATARQVWNRAIDHRPAMIAFCESVKDVQAAVLAARRHHLPISVRATGYDVTGRSVRSNSLVIDVSRMNQVDVRGRIATVAGGTNAAAVIAAASECGLIPVTGWNGVVGMTGLTLNGGYGPLIASHGLALDHLVGAEVVLADGRCVIADADNNTDLLWALRGGGGNFGVVTAMKYRLHTHRHVVGGMILFPWSEAEQVLNGYAGKTVAAGHDLSVVAGMFCLPDGNPALFLAPAWTGDPAFADAIMANLQALGTPMHTQIGTMRYQDLIQSFDARVTNGRNYAVQTRWLPALSPKAISAIVKAGRNLSSPLSTIILQHFRGVATHVALEATAFGLRREHVLVEMISSWEGEDGANHRSWARNLSEALAPDALPGGYPSLLAPDDHDRIAEAYGSNLKRLKSVKQRFDPDGLFSAMPLPV